MESGYRRDLTEERPQNITNGPPAIDSLSHSAIRWAGSGETRSHGLPEGQHDLQALGKALGFKLVPEYVDLRYV